MYVCIYVERTLGAAATVTAVTGTPNDDMHVLVHVYTNAYAHIYVYKNLWKKIIYSQIFM